MTDKADKGWGFEPSESTKDATPEVVEVEEPVVEEPVVEEPAPQDPLTSAEKEAAVVANMIAVARANAAKKTTIDDGKAEKNAAILAGRKKELQKKIASLYTTSVWNGEPNYECTACPYATLDEELIKQHVTKHI